MKRHRIPNVGGAAYKPADLAVGAKAIIYGRTFHVVGVDAFTRSYLEELGIRLTPDHYYPQTPYDIQHASHSAGVQPSSITAPKSLAFL